VKLGAAKYGARNFAYFFETFAIGSARVSDTLLAPFQSE
jgi:hypothetical protein